ncbi:hypothetical protein K466DRAFT_399895 [Polyporus arcularius HHB13444]|uniref:Uncharacterized protein n=1 Tax=Polyporus arcularius HHB13444 TaxID=1314778 RepID=A0A5C3NUJ6_9APHY|nr:hypothetical protein K466DRAFT_399895 [Polyporus arcularius HHB13444]
MSFPELDMFDVAKYVYSWSAEDGGRGQGLWAASSSPFTVCGAGPLFRAETGLRRERNRSPLA